MQLERNVKRVNEMVSFLHVSVIPSSGFGEQSAKVKT